VTLSVPETTSVAIGLEEWQRGLSWVRSIHDGKQVVWLFCPEGHTAILQQPDGGHDIADDGTVSPSVVCPHDDCDFHEHVVLEDWEP
jgi:zona occludens toxin (predicted ATPase)